MIKGFSHMPPEPRQRGQDLVEFALVIPLLLLIVIGVLDLGRAFFASIAVANVAREGARYGINLDWEDICEINCNDGETLAIAAAFREADNTGLDLDNLSVTAECGSCSSDDHDQLEVTAAYDFELILNFILPDFSIQRIATMMIP
jgi:hypothetical protein